MTINWTSLNLPRNIPFYSQQRFRTAHVLIEPLHSSLNENSCKQCPMYIAPGAAEQSNEKPFLCLIYLLEVKEKCPNSTLEQITTFCILYPRHKFQFFANFWVGFVCIWFCMILYILFVYFSCFLKLSPLFRSGGERKKLRWNHNMFSFSCNKQIFFSQAFAGTKYQIWLETINYDVLQRLQSWEKKKSKCLQHVLRETVGWVFFVNSALSRNLYL